MRVSFDYDGTLADHFDGSHNPNSGRALEALLGHASAGDEVFIVTRRYGPENAGLGLVNEHIDPLRLAAGLPVPGHRVVFTNRSLKADRLRELGIDMHYDDCPFEADYFLRRQAGTGMLFVVVSDGPWRVLGAPPDNNQDKPAT